MLKIMTDKHIAKAIVTALRKHQVTVLRVEDVGMDAASDEEILEYAAANSYSILSFDDDFEVLNNQWLQNGQSHCGIFRPLSHLYNKSGIGRIVTFITEYYQLIAIGAGSLQDDVYNQIIYIS